MPPLNTPLLSPERQSALISEIKNGALDQNGKVYMLNWIGGERVYTSQEQLCFDQSIGLRPRTLRKG